MSKHDATIDAIMRAFAPAGFTRFDVGDRAFDPATGSLMADMIESEADEVYWLARAEGYG
jgi:hypothetical protein